MSDVKETPEPWVALMQEKQEPWEDLARPAPKRALSETDTDSDEPLADRVKMRRRAPRPKLTRVCFPTYISFRKLWPR